MSGSFWPASREGAAPGAEAVCWDEVVRRYRAPLRGFFAHRVANAADVDDLVQEVFVQLMKRGGDAPIEHVQQYLFQTAANVLRDQGRKRLVRRHDAHESYEEDLHAVASELSPERLLLGEETLARVAAALRQLPARCQDVFFLRAMDRQPFTDIARLLGVSKSTVEKDMARALMHLDRVINTD